MSSRAPRKPPPVAPNATAANDATPVTAAAMPDLGERRLYINRELSLLAFNTRVLDQALDERMPLLERLKFLLIFSRNMDEFFEIRVAGLKGQIALEREQPGADGMSPQQVLAEIGVIAHRQIERQYAILNERILPELATHGIRIARRDEWTQKQKLWVRRYFRAEVAPLVTPIGLDPTHPFPLLVNKSLNFIVQLEGVDAFGRDSGLAVVPAPRVLPRLIQMPEDLAEGGDCYVLLSSMIHAHAEELFPGMNVLGCYQFRLTRNADLALDPEDVEDLALALRGELYSRRFGSAVRLEVADNCPKDLTAYLLKQFGLAESELYEVNGPVNLARLFSIASKVNYPSLQYKPFVPALPKLLKHAEDLFAVIAKHDVLLLHPYESFTPVVDLLRQAAKDPQVLAIKQTLYRTSGDSPIVRALIEAAAAGKQVVALVEIKARFDEQANIKWARALEQAGVHVAYGLVGLKTHCKTCLVVRREGSTIRRYCHIGTGNYNSKTARLYEDFGLLTADPDIGADLTDLFNTLTGYSRKLSYRNLLVAPHGIRNGIIERVDREIAAHKETGNGHIRLKMYSLVDEQVIDALYRASQAGVRVDVVVRGICALRPGVPGFSENITVRSILGEFLEHSRIFNVRSLNEFWIGSADMMHRNLDRRVEVLVQVKDPRLTAQLNDVFESALNPATRCWELGPEGQWQALPKDGHSVRDHQVAQMDKHRSN